MALLGDGNKIATNRSCTWKLNATEQLRSRLTYGLLRLILEPVVFNCEETSALGVTSIRVTFGGFFIPVSPSFNCGKCVEVPFNFFFFDFCLFSVRLFRHSARGAHETLVGGMHSVAKEKGQNNRECENWSA